MSQIETDIKDALARLALPDGGDLISRDMIRALSVDDNAVRFVIEAPSPAIAQQMEPLRKAAEAAVAAVAGSRTVNAALTAHGPAPAKPAPPSFKIGGHPKPQEGGPAKRARKHSLHCNTPRSTGHWETGLTVDAPLGTGEGGGGEPPLAAAPLVPPTSLTTARTATQRSMNPETSSPLRCSVASLKAERIFIS